MAIESSAQAPASMKAVTTVRRASRIEIGPSVASGATALNGARKRRAASRCCWNRPSARRRCAPARPASPIARSRSGGRLSRVTSCALNRLRRSSSAVRNGCTNADLGALARRRIGLGERRHGGGEAPRRDGAGAGAVAGQPVERVDRGIDHADILRVGRRRARGGRIERRIRASVPRSGSAASFCC